MDIKRFTLAAGVLFVLVGILGFIPGVTTAPHVHDPNLAIEASYGRLLGLFPVNVLHNLVHLALGVWALAVYKNYAQAKNFCKASAVIYGVLTIAGLIPGLNTLFGLVPIHSHDVWLHAVLALATGYYGFVKTGAGLGVRDAAEAAKTNLRWS